MKRVRVRVSVRVVLAFAFVWLAVQGVPYPPGAVMAEEPAFGQSAVQLESADSLLGPDRSEKSYVLADITVWGASTSLPFATRLDRRLAERTPGTFSDPVRATISALPGVTSRDELFVRPSVNGGLPDWVSIYYGGFSDCYPYTLYGTSSIANGQFDQLRLLKGAFPVEYGDALSGVVLIEPKRTVARSVSGNFSLDLVKSSLNISGPLQEYSYALSCESSFYDKVLGSLSDENYPGSYSLMSSVSRVFGPRQISLRTFYALGGVDTRLEASADRYTSATARSRTVKKRHELTIQETGNRTTRTTSLGYFFDTEAYDATDGLMGRDAGTLSDFSADISLRAESFGITHKSTFQITNWHVVDVGASVRKEEVSQFTSTEGWDFMPVFNTGRDDIADTSLAHSDESLSYWKYALFAQNRQDLAGCLVTFGARCDALNSSVAPALRASVERRFGNLTFRVAGGQYLRFPISGTFREGKLAGLVRSYTEPERAVHLVVGCDAEIGPATVTIDLNRQDYSDLVIRDAYGTESRGGTGSLRSVDVTLSSPMDNQDYWAYVTASLGRADIMGIPTDWDQTLVGKAVCFARLPASLEVTTRVFCGSGLAYTPVLARVAQVDATSTPVVDETGQVVYTAVWGEDNSARLPVQFRLDLRVARNWAPFGKNTRLFVEGLNLTNHKNISGVDYLDYYSRTVYRTNVPRAANIGCEFCF
ncbi:MAG: hypothetical protein NTX17_06260 [Candidatus Eisenbacteria bacterium]|nr:hypothetical protein [Candidatus Eisenbacteria bacterium]